MLRRRLALIVAAAVLAALAASGLLVDAVFARGLERELEGLAERELARVRSLVEGSELGSSLLGEEGAGGRVQFVGPDGIVRIPAGEPAPLPEAPAPLRWTDGGRSWIVASGPWRLPSGRTVGTVRVAIDASDALGARVLLLRTLLPVQAGIGLLAVALAVAAVRRALAPLERLAGAAAAVDPARPGIAPHEGPDDEVGRVARALERSLDAIGERRVAEREALAEVAHELAAPLMVASARLESVVARHPDEPDAATARDAASELLHVSRDLLTLARGELEGPLEEGAVDLAAAARAVAAQYGVARVDAPDPPERTEVLGDRGRLVQAIRNLVRNAVQAAGPELVRIEVRRVADEVRLAVHDAGPGMAPERLARAFERGVTGRRGAGGSGLGLSVARRIAERHGARLEARSAPGEGSVFTLRLEPLDAALEPPGTDGPSSGAPLGSEGPTAGAPSSAGAPPVDP